ncbi:MAG TPA: NADH-quinone oxidoreductase subunit NuoG [Armatimonadota bacterium]|nr:NADH-quinone oxidoreductase subunit NuoG [Armatimonadota bacterium]
MTLTIDGQEVTVPKGTNIIEAARKIGIDIPYLCYHHQLTSFGGCRLCLVEVEKVPKLLAACNTTVADGMVVRTTTEKVKSQRAGTLEFILLNHPLDCPVCDKGGECELQDRTFEYSNGLSRMTEPKVHVADYDLGPLIVRNQDRCIICKRCIKVMEEIVGEPVLEFGQRGVTTEVYTFEHEEFKAGFSGNTIRVCPVGALMSKPFRFKARPWELIKTPSVCSLCSVGCNLREDVRENKLLRVVGLENPQVNDGWLCDRGQFGYDYINSAERLTAPLVRGANGQLEETSWEEALSLVAANLKGVKESGGGAAFGAIGSERLSNEDAFALQQFTRQVMGSANVDHRMGSTRSAYGVRPQPGDIVKLGQADVVLIVGSDVTAEAPVLDLILKRNLLKKQMRLIVANPRRTALNKWAAQWLQYAPGQEIALVNAIARALIEEGLVPEGVRSADAAGWDGLSQGLGSYSLAELAGLAGLTEDEVRQTARLLAGARGACILYGQTPADARDGAYFVGALQNVALLSGQEGKEGHVFMEVVQNANTWGARDMGLLPETGPGGAKAESRGLSTGEMLQAAIEGKLQALYIAQSNPLVEFPGAAKVRKALESVPFLVVQDMFLTETAQIAHVVLPVVSVAERNCTLTNVEGRVQRTVRGMDPRGASRPDWWILNMLSEDLGEPLGYSNENSVVKAIRQAVPAASSTAPRLQRVETPRPPQADPNFPMRLFTGKLMFDRSTIQGRSAVLPDLAPDPFIEINAGDAERLGVVAGEILAVNTPYGRLELPVRVSEDVPSGGVFVPDGYNEAPVTSLLSEGVDVVGCRLTRPATQ